MSPHKFRQFLASQKKEQDEKEVINWIEVKERWQMAADEFVAEIKRLLDEFASDIEIKQSEIEITEEELGCYKVPKLEVILPNAKQNIEFIPIGTNLIAAHGRFDMEGVAGKIKWVLVPENADKPMVSVRIQSKETHSDTTEMASKLVWKLATPPPHIRYLPLNQETLLEAIMEVSNG